MTENSKFQWSKFSPDRSEQIVIRTDDQKEFDNLIALYKDSLGQSKAFPDDEGPVATPPVKVQEQARTCPMHNIVMKRREYDGKTFYSHARKTPQGEWEYCNGRLGFPSEQKENGSYRGIGQQSQRNSD